MDRISEPLAFCIKQDDRANNGGNYSHNRVGHDEGEKRFDTAHQLPADTDN